MQVMFFVSVCKCVCLCVWFAGQLLCDPVCDTRSRPAGRQGRGGLHRASRGDFCKWPNGWIIQSNSQAFLAKHICTITVNYTQTYADTLVVFIVWLKRVWLLSLKPIRTPDARKRIKLSVCMILSSSTLRSHWDLGRVCCSYGSRRLFLLYSCAQEQSPLTLQTSACRLIGGVWDGVSVEVLCLTQLIGFLTWFQPGQFLIGLFNGSAPPFTLGT